MGIALEWFDVAIYGFFADTIAKLFFPSTDDTVSLLMAFGTFGISYLVRPLGAVVLGRYADRVGRKTALMPSIKLMMLGTLLSSALSTGQLESWGWRVPFFFGLHIGPVGYAIRRYVDESPAFAHDEDTATGHGPVAEVLRHHKGRVLLAVAALAVSTAITYLITYMPVFAVKDLDLPASTGFRRRPHRGDTVGRPPLRQDRPDPCHGRLRRADPAADPPRVRLPGGTPRIRGDAHRDVPDRSAEGRLLRGAARAAVRPFPALQPRHRDVDQLQPRGDALRRHHPRRDRLARRCHRRQARRHLVFDRSRRPQPGRRGHRAPPVRHPLTRDPVTKRGWRGGPGEA
ncbi:major facilitator family transporter [Streptomyces himastatinicus ATCC 53653]|uniref:Major facilitator family transporter n=1 Tax=Streptomyces himastatinicus ATCC 53653 TaxID=457427 RepID=D9WWT2_9ACTN|nr:major facilitator family transporter [Streptomyces himastatinicus ATCC 53653]